MHLEICLDCVESAIAADRGGADRVELCSALREGGITPSAGLIAAVRAAVSIGVFVLVRPRGGDFVYSGHEFEVAREDILAAKKAGADGVVVGMLTAEGRVDVERTRRLIELARPMQATFHRAFDAAIDLDRALEEVIACGADRLLTSGGEPDAVQGTERIAKLQAAAGKRLRIMPGAGIRLSNAREIAERTGVGDIHTSLGTKVPSTAVHSGARAKIGADADEFSRYLVLEEDVRRLKASLDGIPSGARTN
jgi:copper homeostasis protein